LWFFRVGSECVERGPSTAHSKTSPYVPVQKKGLERRDHGRKLSVATCPKKRGPYLNGHCLTISRKSSKSGKR
jgi:hypothetical protein